MVTNEWRLSTAEIRREKSHRRACSVMGGGSGVQPFLDNCPEKRPSRMPKEVNSGVVANRRSASGGLLPIGSQLGSLLPIGSQLGSLLPIGSQLGVCCQSPSPFHLRRSRCCKTKTESEPICQSPSPFHPRRARVCKNQD
jgi:hypothetical protein